LDRPEIIGALSLVILAIALLALYVYHLAGAWRWIYIATATVALYLNVFVGVVQSFQKIPSLQRLAPTQTLDLIEIRQQLGADPDRPRGIVGGSRLVRSFDVGAHRRHVTLCQQRLPRLDSR
jgi:hypothetical protein